MTEEGRSGLDRRQPMGIRVTLSNGRMLEVGKSMVAALLIGLIAGAVLALRYLCR